MSFPSITATYKRVFACGVGVFTVFVQSCTPVVTPPISTVALGQLAPADGSTVRYVALGNSLTAGYQSGAVVSAETQYAYPTQIARQMGLPFGDGTSQYQYLQYAANGGLGSRNRVASLDSTGFPQLASTSLNSTPSNTGLNRPYNNLGIPGALLRDMNAPIGDAFYDGRFQPSGGNPYFAATLRNTASLGRTCVDQAARINPHFVTIFIGNNDVQGYASSGGVSGTNFTTRAANPSAVAAPTETAVFTAQFNALVDSCARRMPNAKFLVANIPEVTSIPYYTTTGPRIRASLRTALNTPSVVPANIAAIIKQALPDFPNGILVRSSATPNGLKTLSSSDLFVLTASNGVNTYAQSLVAAFTSAAPRIIATPGMAAQIAEQVLADNPMPNALVLDEAEQAVVRRSTTEFNAAIAAAVARYSADNRAALFDTFTMLNNVRTNGYPLSGQTTSSGGTADTALRFDFVSGGFFSLDAIHPSSRGYAAIANEMLKVINSTWKASIPLITITNVPSLSTGQ